MGSSAKSLDAVHHLVEIVAAVGAIVFGARKFFEPEAINVSRIYTTIEASRLLHMDRLGVIRLVKTGDIPARKSADGNYEIVGRALVDYLSGMRPSP